METLKLPASTRTVTTSLAWMAVFFNTLVLDRRSPTPKPIRGANPRIGHATFFRPEEGADSVHLRLALLAYGGVFTVARAPGPRLSADV